MSKQIMKYYYSETMKAANVQFLLPPKSIPFVKKKKKYVQCMGCH